MIIAEFCQNHNGDFGLLTKMVESAAENGATHGKIQAIFAENVSFRPQFEEGLSENGKILSIKRPYKEEYDRLKGLEISVQQMGLFCELCRSVGLEPMTTCFARDNIPELSNVGFSAIKVASYDCASYQMLRELKEAFDQIVVSTGAAFDNEIEYAANILGDSLVAFLHCVTIYPTPIHELHLARLEYLRSISDRVGFSDHSLVARDGLIGSKAALALGADVVERHFTVLSPGKTKDGPVSINPGELKELADFAKKTTEERVDYMDQTIPDWRRLIGHQHRRLTDEELLNRDYYRGRFASRRPQTDKGRPMIFNWEEIPLE